MTRTLWTTYLVFFLLSAGLFWVGEHVYHGRTRKVFILVLGTMVAYWVLPTWRDAIAFSAFAAYFWAVAKGCAYFKRECLVEVDRARAYLA